jgi:DNA-binding transcriptional MerR regulator
MSDTQQAERIYIRQAADELGRRMATLRKWEQLGLLPKHLRAHRGHRGWRYWTPAQIDGLKKWIKDTDRRPGKGLPHYHPNEAQQKKAMQKMRKPRRRPSQQAE